MADLFDRKVLYGMDVPDQEDGTGNGANVYKVEIQEDGQIWVTPFAWFPDPEAAKQLCDGYNGVDTG